MNPLLFASQLQFLDKISYPEIHIPETFFTFITGESGCGKSTLFRLLNKTILPSSGTILYRNQNLQTLDTISYRRKVLLAPQDVFLFEGTLQQNFALYAEYRDEAPADRHTISHLLKTCCIDLFPDTLCDTLSGGERQRVFLAICLSFSPDIILLDEPTSALDTGTARCLLSNIKSSCRERGITPVAICHTEELVNEFSDYTLRLKKDIKR